jgi:hypothetical protein
MAVAASALQFRAPRKGVTMNKIQALVRKFRPAKDLSRNAWPLHQI